jgi:hypothetical protein
MQGVKLITNAVPVTKDGQPMATAGRAKIESVTVAGSTQSNGHDCGCHTAMALRAMAAAAAAGRRWDDALLPDTTDARRDRAWRNALASDCLQRRLCSHLDLHAVA